MPVAVRLPKLGEGVVEGTISRWLKQEGETVEELEPLLEVATDKVDTEIPAPTSGTVLKILYPEGATVAVGAVLAYIGEPGEPVPQGGSAPATQAPAPQEATPQPAPAVAAPAAPPAPPAAPPPPPPEQYRPGRHPQLGYISPIVAKLANEKGVNLALVKGTGLGGRITKDDLLAYLEKGGATVAPPPPPVPPAPQPVAPTAPPPPAPAPPPPAGAPHPVPTLPGDTIAPLNRMRKSIAEHMVRSKFTAPHAVTVMEADLSRVAAHRAAHKAEYAQAGVRLTYTAYFMLAAAHALRAFPIVNTSWSEEGLIWHREVNIGMAVSLDEDGLIVPVVRHADELSLLGMAKAVNDLAQRARNRKLRPDEISGSTFSVTNHGVTGSLFAAPIINQPNVAIMGVGAIKKRPIVVTDEWGHDSIAIHPMVYLTLSFDHRVLDGAVADMFLGKVVEILEKWQ